MEKPAAPIAPRGLITLADARSSTNHDGAGRASADERARAAGTRTRTANR